MGKTVSDSWSKFLNGNPEVEFGVRVFAAPIKRFRLELVSSDGYVLLLLVAESEKDLFFYCIIDWQESFSFILLLLLLLFLSSWAKLICLFLDWTERKIELLWNLHLWKQ